MVSFRVIPALLTSALLLASAAHSASITNRDAKDRKVTIIEGDTQKNHVIKPGEALAGVCEKGCLVRLDDFPGDPYELEGPEITSIEEGQLYEDVPEVPARPNADKAGQPSQPGKRN